MKKKEIAIIVQILFVVAAIAIMTGHARADSSMTMTSRQLSGDAVEVVIDWTAAENGTVTSVATSTAITQMIQGKYIISGETKPGSTAPQDNYDVAVNDDQALDLAGTLLNNRDSTNPELVNIGLAAHGYPLVRSPLTIAISGNNVNSATGKIILLFTR